ncbi:MAG TPA: hypothetical protein VGV67_04350 [Solirubrobacteraceae bacterium]|nr:hypothetical protein [Solirubrobacteraceae bacterium]
MKRSVSVALLAVAGLAASPAPSGASCLPRDARMVLAAADAGVVGTVVERRGEDEYVIRVERVVKGAVEGADVVVRDPSARTSIGLSARPGERLGLGLHAEASGWTATGCDRAAPDAMLLAGDSAPPCVVGGTVAVPQQRREHILGCLGSAAPLELRAHRRPGGTLCVGFADLTLGIAPGCGTNRRRGSAPGWVERTVPGGPGVRFDGPVVGAVRSVRIDYVSPGGLRVSLPAPLVRVDAPSLLRTLGVSRPFGRIVAAVPRGSTRVRLSARDARGRPLGRVVVPPRIRARFAWS